MGSSPPQGWGRLDSSFGRIRAICRRVLQANVPGAKVKELDLRTRAVAGMLSWLVVAPIGQELREVSEKQLERLLVPIVAGAFRGTTSR